MEQIVVLPEVKLLLEHLIETLYEQEYFGFKDSAEAYVHKVVRFISTIPFPTHKKTKLSKFGQWYCSYKHNRHTTYYLTFDTEGELYIIKNVFSNHCLEYPIYI